MEPVSTGLRAVGALWTLLKPITTDEQFKEQRNRMLLDWLADVAQAVNRMEERFRGLADQLDGRATSNFFGTYASFTPTAMGALSPSHRSLYAAAVANVLRPDFETEMKSRVLRAVHQLEPGDIVHLRGVASATGEIGPMIDRSYRRAELLSKKSPEAMLEVFRESALEKALCLEERAQVTPLGREVLRFLEQWNNEG